MGCPYRYRFHEQFEILQREEDFKKIQHYRDNNTFHAIVRFIPPILTLISVQLM